MKGNAMDESRVRQKDEDRESEATSKETLEDLEKSEAASNDQPGEQVNSPDGSFDEAEELDKAGPM